MSYTKRIEFLNESIRLLDQQIADANTTATQLQELKDRRSQYDSEVRRLNRLEWEERTQRVDLDDRY